MSTLGRKAMKKTLERLEKNAKDDMKRYVKARGIVNKDPKNRAKLSNLIFKANMAIVSLIDYAETLYDYCSELDEHWDKKEENEMKKLVGLIRKSGEQKQPKPIQKKEEAKKTPYIK